MKKYADIPLLESLDGFAWNPEEVRDLVRVTPLDFDDEGQSTGHAAHLFGLEVANGE